MQARTGVRYFGGHKRKTKILITLWELNSAPKEYTELIAIKHIMLSKDKPDL